jgi:hypothetical protein
VIELMPLSLRRIFPLQPAVEIIVWLAGLADQDTQVTGDAVDLDTAYRQPRISGPFHQTRGFAALEAREPARALLGWLGGVWGHKRVFCLLPTDSRIMASLAG